MQKNKVKLTLKRKERNKYKVKQHNKSLRHILSVSRSNKNIYAQILDLDGKVIVSFSSKHKDAEQKTKGKKGIEIAEIIGQGLAEAALKNKVKEVVFNKGAYLYTGRVKALGDAARKNGLIF